MVLRILLFVLASTVCGAQGLLNPYMFTPVQSHDITVTAQSDVSISISWTIGSGLNRVVIVKAAEYVDSNPVDNTTYTANTTFGSGTQLGTGNYTVYNGNGNSVTVTGLTANTKYAFRIYEYNGAAGAETYNVTQGVLNPLGIYSFTTEYQAVIARAGVRSFTVPTISDQVLDNQMMRRLKLEGILSIMDAFYWTANSVQDFGRLNWKTPASNEITLISSPTFTANQGFTGNGTSSYLNTNFTPSTGTNYTQNGASVGLFITDESQSAGLDLGSISTGPLRLSLTVRAATNQAFTNINDNTTVTTSNSLSFGYSHLIRTSSTANRDYQSLKQIHVTGSNTSTARPTATVYVGARHNTTAGDVADNFSTHRIGSIHFGNVPFAKINPLYAAIIARYKKFVPVLGTVSKTGITAIDAYGDSFTVGQNATTPTTDGYIYVFRDKEFPTITGGNFVNHAVAGKGAWVGSDAASKVTNNNGTSRLWVEMVGQNDVYRNGSAVKTLNKIEAFVRTMFVNHAGTAFVASGSSSCVRTGNYTTAYNASSVGGRYTNAAIPSSTSAVINSSGTAGTVSYTFTGTAIGVQLVSDSGVAGFGTCGISIDGVLRETVDLNVWYDNISDGVNSNQTGPVAFWYVGLSNTSHTITVTANGDGQCPVDYFIPMMDGTTMKPIIFTELPYRLTYASPSVGTQADWDIATSRKLAMCNYIRAQGYNVIWYSVNKYYDQTDVDPDLIHPLDGGHRQIASGMAHLFDGN